MSVPPQRQQSQAPPQGASSSRLLEPPPRARRTGQLSPRAEVGADPPPPPRAMQQERAAPAGLPWQHPGPTRGLRLPGRGRQAAPGKGCPAGLGRQKPTGARRTWLARLSTGQWRAFHQEGLSPTPGLRRWGLGCERGHSGHLLGS